MRTIRAGAHNGAPLSTADMIVNLVDLAPGDSFPNHFHEHHEEAFVILAGRARLWVNRRDSFDLSPGDVAVCARGEQHLFMNVSDSPVRFVFFKSANMPDDRVVVEWTPPGWQAAPPSEDR